MANNDRLAALLSVAVVKMKPEPFGLPIPSLYADQFREKQQQPGGDCGPVNWPFGLDERGD